MCRRRGDREVADITQTPAPQKDTAQTEIVGKKDNAAVPVPEKVKVCCFCERWESGGIESFLCNVLCHMDLSGLEVDIVAAQMGDSIFTAPLTAHGIRFYELSGRQNSVFENHRLFWKLLAERQYDVVHLNIFHGLSLCYGSLARQAGIPVRIAHSHNSALRKSRARPLKLLVHYISRGLFSFSVTDLWACSGMAAKFLFSKKALVSKDFHFIPNGIDVERFQFNASVREKVREELGLRNKYVIGNIGRLCYQKNQEFLIEIFSELLRGRPESCLLLVGAGEAEPMLRKKAEDLGVAGASIFYGTSARVEQLMWAMDVFVMPSRFEGLPVTGIEAQASGLPCVFSDAVTQECRICGSTQFISLSEPAEVWAEKISHISGCGNREDAASAAQEAGFSIVDVALRIKKSYLRAEGYGRSEDFSDHSDLPGGAVSLQVCRERTGADLSQHGGHSGR